MKNLKGGKYIFTALSISPFLNISAVQHYILHYFWIFFTAAVLSSIHTSIIDVFEYRAARTVNTDGVFVVTNSDTEIGSLFTRLKMLWFSNCICNGK